MNKKTLLAIGMGLLFGSGTVLAQSTDPVLIDFDGGEIDNSAQLVGSLDWFVSSSLANQALVSPTDFTLYNHGALSGASDIDGNPIGISGLNTDFEWTYITGFNETITSASQDTGALLDDGGDGTGGGNDVYEQVGTINLSDSGNQDDFFFHIYYDTNTNSDALSGTGFDDGQLILTGASPINVSGNFTSTLGSFVDNDDNGILSPGDTIIDDPGPGDTNWVYSLLDSFGNDDWSDADITYYSVEGEGATALDTEVGSQDTDYFVTLISSIFSDLVFSTENVDPFLETNPSKCYDTDGTTMADNDGSTACLADGDIVLGDGSGNSAGDQINGIQGLGPFFTGDGQDLMFQTDANQAFRKAIPEPGIIALLGLGLGLLGMTRRRRA